MNHICAVENYQLKMAAKFCTAYFCGMDVRLVLGIKSYMGSVSVI